MIRLVGFTKFLVLAFIGKSNTIRSWAFQITPITTRHTHRTYPRLGQSNARSFSLPGRLAQTTTNEGEYFDDSSPDPVDSVQELDALVPLQEIVKLSKSKSDFQGTIQVLWHAGCYVAAALLYSKSPLLSTIAMSFVSSFFFHGLHETVHQTAFKSKYLNDVVAHLLGFLCARPAQHYRYYHWQHHRYTGNPELDSELQSGSFLDFPINSIISYIWFLSGIPFWIDASMSLFRHAIRGNCSEVYLKDKPNAQRRVVREARVYLGLYVMTAIILRTNPILRSTCYSIRTILMRYWIIPTFLGQPFLRFYLLAEHQGRMESPLIYENTRTMTGTNALYQKLAWNMPYHMEHHSWPSIPFWKLPEVHHLLCSDNNTKSVAEVLDRGEVSRSNKKYLHKGYIALNFGFLKELSTKKRES